MPALPDLALPVPLGALVAGKYRVERVLGAGGMGIVVAATHLALDALVALKFLRPDAASDATWRRRFELEARAAHALSSEHVARVIDLGVLPDGALFLALEYLDGQPLDELLRAEGPMAPARAVDLVLEAAEALAEAHARGIVHRDLKPGNLFLARRADGRRVIKVLDFGIAKWFGAGADGALTETAAVLGSTRYMSPEQLRSSRDVTARADLWSLGVVLFELIAGRTPFVGTQPEVAAAILWEEPPRLRAFREDAPPGLEQAIARCLEREPSRRFAGVAALAEALAPFGTRAAALSAERIARAAAAGAAPGTTTEDTLCPAPLTPALVARAVRAEPTAAPLTSAPAPRSAGSAGRFLSIGGLAAAAVFAAALFGRPRAPRPELSVTPPAPTSSAGPALAPEAAIAVPSVQPSAASRPAIVAPAAAPSSALAAPSAVRAPPRVAPSARVAAPLEAGCPDPLCSRK
jgi:serine/threonine-protein kinase